MFYRLKRRILCPGNEILFNMFIVMSIQKYVHGLHACCAAAAFVNCGNVCVFMNKFVRDVCGSNDMYAPLCWPAFASSHNAKGYIDTRVLV